MFNRRAKPWIVFIVAMAAVLLVAHVATACPTCKDGMEANDPEHAGMVQGYFYSILFMMGMPYLVFSSWALYMYFEVKKARKRKAAEAAAVLAGAVPTSAFVNGATGAMGAPTEVRELVEA